MIAAIRARIVELEAARAAHIERVNEALARELAPVNAVLGELHALLPPDPEPAPEEPKEEDAP